MKIKNAVVAGVLGAILELGFTSTVAAQSYSFLDLGTLGGSNSGALAINNGGQVVGYSFTAGNVMSHATLWNGTAATDLGTLGGSDSRAFDINDSGQVVGESRRANKAGYHATLWSGGIASDLGTLGGAESSAKAINNAGQVVGFSYTGTFYSGTPVVHATTWNGTSATDLGTLGGYFSIADSINSVGQSVGFSTTATPAGWAHATMWTGSTVTDLRTLRNGLESQARDINDIGQIVGFAAVSASNSDNHATLWNGGIATDLGTLGGRSSFAYAINNIGQVVGRSWTAGDIAAHAFLWSDGKIIDLNSFLTESQVGAGWEIRDANDINDTGSIAVNAYNKLTGEQHAGLLVAIAQPEKPPEVVIDPPPVIVPPPIAAIPEPETYAMMLAGLALLGVVRRRRKQTHARG